MSVPTFAAFMPRDEFVHRNRQRMTKLAHLVAVLYVRRKPRTFKIGVVLFQQSIPLLE